MPWNCNKKNSHNSNINFWLSSSRIWNINHFDLQTKKVVELHVRTQSQIYWLLAIKLYILYNVFYLFILPFSTNKFTWTHHLSFFISHCMNPKRSPRALLIIYSPGNFTNREEIKPWLWSSSFRIISFCSVVTYWNDRVWAIPVSKNKNHTWMSFVSFMSF